MGAPELSVIVLIDTLSNGQSTPETMPVVLHQNCEEVYIRARFPDASTLISHSTHAKNVAYMPRCGTDAVWMTCDNDGSNIYPALPKPP